MYDLYFEDFKVGDKFTTPGITVTESQIIDFAMHWDPQPFHMDAEASQRHNVGGLIASGFHTLCLSFRLFQQIGVLARCNLASPGFDSLRWLKPVRPGDTLHVVAEVTEARPSRSKPDRGAVRMLHSTFDQTGETVMTVDCTHILKRREASPA
jgi:acyl dehydratase